MARPLRGPCPVITGTSGGNAEVFQAPGVTVLRAAGPTSGHQGVLQAPSDVPPFGDRTMRRTSSSPTAASATCAAPASASSSPTTPDDLATLPHDGEIWDTPGGQASPCARQP